MSGWYWLYFASRTIIASATPNVWLPYKRACTVCVGCDVCHKKRIRCACVSRLLSRSRLRQGLRPCDATPCSKHLLLLINNMTIVLIRSSRAQRQCHQECEGRPADLAHDSCLNNQPVTGRQRQWPRKYYGVAAQILQDQCL